MQGMKQVIQLLVRDKPSVAIYDCLEIFFPKNKKQLITDLIVAFEFLILPCLFEKAAINIWSRKDLFYSNDLP